MTSSDTLQDGTAVKKKILIIEDNIESQLIFKVYLRHKFSLEIVGDAVTGIEAIRGNNFDLILLDINLPGKLNGVDVLNKIRNEFNLINLPVIVVTAYAVKGDKQRFLDLGANEYLSKPVLKEDLLKEVNKFLA